MLEMAYERLCYACIIGEGDVTLVPRIAVVVAAADVVAGRVPGIACS